MLCRYKQKLHVASQTSRFTGITVGTDFDPKELMFRNYLGIISQDSKPAARIVFSAGEKEVFSIGWIDPSGRLVAKNKLQVIEPSLYLTQKNPKIPVNLYFLAWEIFKAPTITESHPSLTNLSPL